MLDERTFGDSPAAIDLVKIINERGLKSNRISRLLCNFNKTLSYVSVLPKDMSANLMSLYYSDVLSNLDKFETPINTYGRNVVSTIYKKWLIKQKRK